MWTLAGPTRAETLPYLDALNALDSPEPAPTGRDVVLLTLADDGCWVFTHAETGLTLLQIVKGLDWRYAWIRWRAVTGARPVLYERDAEWGGWRKVG